jgi:hypothetical protein
MKMMDDLEHLRDGIQKLTRAQLGPDGIKRPSLFFRGGDFTARIIKDALDGRQIETLAYVAEIYAAPGKGLDGILKLSEVLGNAIVDDYEGKPDSVMRSLGLHCFEAHWLTAGPLSARPIPCSNDGNID